MSTANMDAVLSCVDDILSNSRALGLRTQLRECIGRLVAQLDHSAGTVEVLSRGNDELRRRLAALENRDATTREACELIHRAAERLRKDGAVSTDDLRAAEARGFERARGKAADIAKMVAAEWHSDGGSSAETEQRIRAMKDETP